MAGIGLGLAVLAHVIDPGREQKPPSTAASGRQRSGRSDSPGALCPYHLGPAARLLAGDQLLADLVRSHRERW